MITGLAFSPNGEHMYSAGSQGILVLYQGSTEEFNVQRILINTVAPGEHFAPDVLSVSDDGQRLAVIGPFEYVITVMDCRTLDEVSKEQVSTSLHIYWTMYLYYTLVTAFTLIVGDVLI